MAVGFFQFATSSVHLATALMLADEESLDNECHFYFWPNRTLAPNRMAANFPFGALSDFKFQREALKSCPLVLFHHFFERFPKKVNEYKKMLSNINFSNDFVSLKLLNQITPGLGSAIANHLASESNLIDLSDSRKKYMLLQLIKSYIQVFENVVQEVNKHTITKVYLYNGRFLHERAVWEACKSLGVEVLLFENTQDRYHLSNWGFHNRNQNQSRIKNFWETARHSIDERLVIAKKYYERLESAENPFFRSDSAVDLPEKYIAYFSNSDREAIGFWDEWNQPFGSQLEAIKVLAESTRNIGISLVLRMHPNSGLFDGKRDNYLGYLIEHGNVTLILSSSNVSSYEIMKKSCGIVTYGSTIGLEAAWNEIPCAVLADCKYDQLDVADKIVTQKEMLVWLEKLLKSNNFLDLKKRKLGAASWAFYIETGGDFLRNCEVVPGAWGAYQVKRYKNTQLMHSIPVLLLGLVYLKFKKILFFRKTFLG
jgi:hypothetical protein